MKAGLILFLLGMSVAWMPAAHAQYYGWGGGGGSGWGAYNGVGTVQGIGPDSFMSYTGTGLALASPLTTRDMLSSVYGITQPELVNNFARPIQTPIPSNIANGCYGSCFF